MSENQSAADPRIAAIQAYLSDQRAAGRWVFGLVNPEIAELLAVADRAAVPAARAAELGRLIQKAHAYWVSIGAPGAEENSNGTT